VKRWEHVRRYDIFNARAGFPALEAMQFLIRGMEEDGWQMVTIDEDSSWWKREVETKDQ
jgi:hypothetical protein